MGSGSYPYVVFQCLLNWLPDQPLALFLCQASDHLRPQQHWEQTLHSRPLLISMDVSSLSKMPAQTNLFQIYLRLRPAGPNQTAKAEDSEPWLVVEPPSPTTLEAGPQASTPTHITLQPPNDSRKRAVEKFGFTKVFREEATQLDIFDSTGTVQLVKNVLNGGRDGLVATLGVTGSGKVEQLHQSKPTLAQTADRDRATPFLDLVHNAASHK